MGSRDCRKILMIKHCFEMLGQETHVPLANGVGKLISWLKGGQWDTLEVQDGDHSEILLAPLCCALMLT